MTQLDLWLQPVVILIASLVFLSICREWIFRILEKWTSKTESDLDDKIIASLKKPSWLGIVYISFFVAIPFLPRGFGQHPHIPKIQMILLILLGSWIALRISKIWLTRPTAFGAPLQVRNLLWRISQVGIQSLAAVMILDTMGISVTPLLASLGVGSIAVALALQDTLGNLFSGFYLQIDRPVGLNDYIRLEDGTEGTVLRIGWRSTHLQLLTGNRTIIPNTRLANSVILNYTLGHRESLLSVPIGVAYTENLKRVEKIAIEVASEIQAEVDGASRNFSPVVRFTALADSSINFNVVLQLDDITAQGLVRHEFIKRVHDRFYRERIEIPFPQRVVHVKSADPSLPPGP